MSDSWSPAVTHFAPPRGDAPGKCAQVSTGGAGLGSAAAAASPGGQGGARGLVSAPGRGMGCPRGTPGSATACHGTPRRAA